MKLRIASTALAIVLTAAFGTVRAEEKPAAKPYPLTTCVVSGEKLGSMGKPFAYDHEGREIRFCCKNCVKDFKKEPAKYLKKLDDAGKK